MRNKESIIRKITRAINNHDSSRIKKRNILTHNAAVYNLVYKSYSNSLSLNKDIPRKLDTILSDKLIKHIKKSPDYFLQMLDMLIEYSDKMILTVTPAYNIHFLNTLNNTLEVKTYRSNTVKFDTIYDVYQLLKTGKIESLISYNTFDSLLYEENKTNINNTYIIVLYYVYDIDGKIMLRCNILDSIELHNKKIIF